METPKELYRLPPVLPRELCSDHVQHLVCHLHGGVGHIWAIRPYPGVVALAADFAMPCFSLPYMEQYPYLKFNYCIGGRCEVPLDNHRYAYLENSVLSIDLNQSLGALLLPTGLYQGLELILDLDVLAAQYPAAWQECGVALLDIRQRLASRAGSVRLRPPPRWDALARQLAARLQGEDLAVEDARFFLLQLLYLLKDGADTEEITTCTLLTRGQHALAVRAEQRLTADLAVHIPIEPLAAELGVSASALKKYFGQVYGKPISRYLREKRIAQAKRLLVGTSQTVGAIALATGYQNQSKFGAVFRDATGATPSEYRRLHRAAHPSKGEETT